jgi:putative peptide zinc metalloprotease protein
MDGPVSTAVIQMGTAASRLPVALPPLREELQLHPAAAHADGSPAWVIQDPVTNAFYRIGWLEFELLSRWALGAPQLVLSATTSDTLLKPGEDELADLYEFLLAHQLLSVHHAGYTRHLAQRHRKQHMAKARWLLHHYLFFRLPLLNPAATLQKILPWLSWLFTRGTALGVASLCLLGLLLTARQWDAFSASFVDTLTLGGLGGYLAALAVTKSLHELGHALTATRYGLRVAHMGVAFVVMWPMLYTDTGESWRLRDRRQRLAIASAGLVTELALAGLAMLAWNLAADGSALKQSLFYLASTAWLISLTLNISPFMRFDGYFIVSDALDLPNLHERASALARTALRNTLLGWADPDPERFEPGRRRALIAFAYITWVYRLGVFLGIAAAVYLFFFKLLGLFLFAVEVVWFVLRPVAAELRVWASRRSEIRRGRRWLAVLFAGGLLLAAAVPWGVEVHAPAWAHPETHGFYSPLPARVVRAPSRPGSVAAGAPVFELEQPEIGYRADASRAASEAVESELRGLTGEANGEERRFALLQRQAMRAAEWQAQQDEAGRLQLKAPFAGLVADIDPELAPGVWVTPRQPLAILVDPSRWQAEAFVSQADLSRLKTGSQVRFHASGADAVKALNGTVTGIESTRTVSLPHPMLSNRHGGPITVLQEGSGLAPRDALYRVRIRLDEPAATPRMLLGQAVIEGESRSWLVEALKPAVVVLIREFGF